MFLNRGWMGSYPLLMALAPYTSPSQSSRTQWGWGFHTERGGIDPGGHRYRARVVGVVYMWGGLRYGDGNISSPGRRICPLPWWACILLGWRWLYEVQPISDQPTGLGFHTVPGRYHPGGFSFSFPGCRSCRCMEGLTGDGALLSSPGCAGSLCTSPN